MRKLLLMLALLVATNVKALPIGLEDLGDSVLDSNTGLKGLRSTSWLSVPRTN